MESLFVLKWKRREMKIIFTYYRKILYFLHNKKYTPFIFLYYGSYKQKLNQIFFPPEQNKTKNNTFATIIFLINKQLLYFP